ncbi:Rieske 2Fe-2S domain-containing protein [Mucilaginibacter sp. HMF5004]|uniref:Rieske (2Fe-2S) protein n=1 Tax=Mucilaginibacter rivuli TaxID=2857527 RepID=UPI001C6079D6|nr:Rieske 2Fe-2S domain-containing protein [Mucilaginibacter rivuli]MBW4889509.1 Rieske 2Fe-2S domain-containing protein [Mucilaginibacter rivuli]
MNWHKVLDNSDLKYPFISKVKAGSKIICLVGVDNEVYALAAKCPHAGADISQGWCTDGKLTCPFHRYGYDIKTGRGNPGQGDYLQTYPVAVREDGVYVGVKSIWDIFG